MKSTLLRFLSFGLLVVCLIWPTSCARIIDVNLPPAKDNAFERTVITAPEINTNVYVLDSTDNDKLIELTDLYLLFKQTPKLRNGRLAATLKVEELKVGDVVLGNQSPVATNGFAAKVTRVTTQGQNVKIDYTNPTFLDIFKKLNEKWRYSYGTGKSRADGTGEEESDMTTVTIPVSETAAVGQNTLEVKGSATVSALKKVSTEVELVLEDKKWQKIRIEMTTTRKIKGGLTIETTLSRKFPRDAGFKKNMVCRSLPSIKFFVGRVPVFIKPVVSLDAVLTLSGGMKIDAEVVGVNESSSSGLLYDGQGWSEIKKETPAPTGSRLAVEISGKAEVGVEGKLEGFFYQFGSVDCSKLKTVQFSAGVSLKGYGGLEGVCQVASGQSGSSEVRLYRGLEGKLFLTTKLFGLDFEPSASEKWEKDLDKWPINTVFCQGEIVPIPTDIPDQVEESPTAVSTADPHMTTFDRGRYDFMAVGEFLSAKSTTDNFLVQVRQSPYPGSTQVSVNVGLAVQAGSDMICVYPPNRLYVNRQAVPLNFTDYKLNNDGLLTFQGNRLTIKTANGDVVEVKLLAADLDYYITPAKNRKGKLSGILGNYDGNAQNDIAKADGQVLKNDYTALYPTFADSWRIKQTESMFVYETGKNTDSYTDKAFPRSEVQLSAAQSAAAEQICRQAGVTDPAALQGCIVDVALTGNRGFADRAKDNEVVSGAKTTLSVSNFAQYRNEFVLGSGGIINGNTAVLPSKGTIRWNDAYLNRDGFETEIVLAVTAPSPCFPLFDLEVVDLQNAGVQNFLRLSTNNGRTQVELVNSTIQPQFHPVNVFDGNRHRVKINTYKVASGVSTILQMEVRIDNYEPLLIRNLYPTSSLAGYLYPTLKNETLNCNNGLITIYGWSFKSQ